MMVVFWQDKDLKQYMDDCGNIMSMHNVKVSGFFSDSDCLLAFSVLRISENLIIRIYMV